MLYSYLYSRFMCCDRWQFEMIYLFPLITGKVTQNPPSEFLQIQCGIALTLIWDTSLSHRRTDHEILMHVHMNQ